MMLRPRIGSALGLILVVGAIGLGPDDAFATAVTFRYRPAATPSSVNLAGTFNQWSTSATSMANADGTWEVTIELAPGMHQYKYVVDGNEWITDEWALDFSDDGFGGKNSVVVVGDRAMSAGEGSRAIGPGGESVEVMAKGTSVTFNYRPLTKRVNSVSVAGSFNDWDAAANVLMDEDGDGVWSIAINLEAGDIAFQFVIDGDEWVDTKVGPNTEPDGFGGQRARATVGATAMELGP